MLGVKDVPGSNWAFLLDIIRSNNFPEMSLRVSVSVWPGLWAIPLSVPDPHFERDSASVEGLWSERGGDISKVIQ